MLCVCVFMCVDTKVEGIRHLHDERDLLGRGRRKAASANSWNARFRLGPNARGYSSRMEGQRAKSQGGGLSKYLTALYLSCLNHHRAGARSLPS